MRDLICVTGIVLKSSDYAEYDRRITLLTHDRGKITVFVHGARRSGNAFMASTEPFVFGDFFITEGKSAYNMQKADISNYFEELRGDLEGFYLGSYILEVADYYSRENNDELELLKLVYQSTKQLRERTMLNLDTPLKAVVSGKFSRKLIKAVFQIKSVVVNGEFPGVPADIKVRDGTKHAVEHVVNSSIERLYTFTLTEEVLKEFSDLSDRIMAKVIPRRFKSLEVYGRLL